MYKRILIPTDGSPTAAKAITEGVAFAKDARAKVVFFTAVPEYEVPGDAELMSHQFTSMEEHARRGRELAAQRFAPAIAAARAARIEFELDSVDSNFPSVAIVAAAKRHGCDAIVMSSHARTGISRLLHGSETAEVLSHSELPTLVYR